jgi:hypothetical protein
MGHNRDRGRARAWVIDASVPSPAWILTAEYVGTARNEYVGTAVALSSNGLAFLYGAAGNVGTNVAGYVRSLRWDEGGQQWTLDSQVNPIIIVRF